MKDFPEQSISQAREIARKYKLRGRAKEGIAENLYHSKFYEIYYGFGEALRKGNCGQFLHEIDKEADCFGMLGVLYLIAREAGLKPRMWSARNMRDVPEGGDPNDALCADHSFITVKVNNADYMVDPFMVLLGEAKFNEGDHVIRVSSSHEAAKITNRGYATLSEISQQEYLDLLEKQRTPEGGRIALSSTQKVRAAGKNTVFVSYLSNSCELRSSIRAGRYIFCEKPDSREVVYDLTTRVSEDGSFDFRKGIFSIYRVSSTGWAEHENPQTSMNFSTETAELAWRVFDEIFFALGRKTSPRRGNLIKLSHELRRAGFLDNLTLQPGSVAERTVLVKSLNDVFRAFNEEGFRIITNYVERCRTDDLSNRCLLRRAQYDKKSDALVSPSNPWGLLYPGKERQALIEAEFEVFLKSFRRFGEALIEEKRVSAGLVKGSLYSKSRKTKRAMEFESTMARPLENICRAKQSSFPLSFDLVADATLFNSILDLESSSIQTLESGLTEEDLRITARKRFFDYLVATSIIQDSLFLRGYHKGLKRILDRR